MHTTEGPIKIIAGIANRSNFGLGFVDPGALQMRADPSLRMWDYSGSGAPAIIEGFHVQFTAQSNVVFIKVLWHKPGRSSLAVDPIFLYIHPLLSPYWVDRITGGWTLAEISDRFVQDVDDNRASPSLEF